MKIFVTGITGFIGSHLTKRLVDDDHEVSGLIRHSSNRPSVLDNLENSVKLYRGNLLDYCGLINILKDAQPDVICHLGAITPVAYSFGHPIEVNEVNFIGTMRLVEAAKKITHLKRFIFSSSMEVYGWQKDRIAFTEDLEPHPLAPYGVSKYAAEKYLELQARVYDFPAMSFRQTNTYGREHNDYFVIEAFITKMLKAKRGFVDLGRKEPVRNFIHINDLVDLWSRAINKNEATFKDKAQGKVFNTGPDNGLTIEKLYEIIATKLGWQGRANWNTVEMRAGEVFYLNSTGDKAQDVFDWEPLINLNDGIDQTIEYWKGKIK
jgi:UDP-glucose 4-epimerase